MADIKKIKIGSTTYNIRDVEVDNKLDKITCEWNREVSFGGSGYLKIGEFPMYDTNLTIDIDSTAGSTYHATIVIATQNASSSSMGSVHEVNVYGDASNTITPKIRVVWNSGSNIYTVYFIPDSYSKNLIHIRAVGVASYPWENKICVKVTGTPPNSTAGLEAKNMLKTNYLSLSGGTMTGSIKLKEENNILLRPSASDYYAGIGYDTRGNECIALWAKSAATRLRWHAGVDMSTSTHGMMMDRTPDFEISKASGNPIGYIGGKQISVDGHTHTSISTVASINGENTTNYPWRRIMSVPSTTGSWVDAIGTYYLSGNYNGGPYYLFRMEFRTNHSAVGDRGDFNIRIIATNSDPNNLAIASYSVVTNGVTTNYSDVFVKVPSYPRMVLTRLCASDTGTIIYYNSKEGSGASSRTEAYIDINGSGTGYASYELHSLSEYTSLAFGTLTAKVSEAVTANHALTAGYLLGFSRRTSNQEWGNRTGTFITGMDDSTGGSIAWRRDNPNPGQMSMIIDGTVYVNEGNSEVIHTGNIGSQNVNYANSAGSVAWGNVTGKPSTYPPDSHTHSYLPLDGSKAMLGTLILPINKIGLKFRNDTTWEVGTFYGTADNEALTFYTKDINTSFQFINNYTPDSTDSWQKITPALQIRNNKVIINKKLANGVSSDYNLEVNGTIYASGEIIARGGLDLANSSTGIKIYTDAQSTPYYVTNIESGSVTLSGMNQASSGTRKTISVNFHNGSKGSGSWYVVATVKGSSSTFPEYVTVGVTNISNSGFTINARKITSSPGGSPDLDVNYVAIKYY